MHWLKKLKHHHLDTPENVLFALSVKFQHFHPDLLDWACENLGDIDKVGALLTEVVDGKIRLKDDLDKNSFNNFLTHLKKNGMTAEGHVANRMKYPLGIASIESQFEFDRFLSEYEKVEIPILAKKIARFYERGEYLPKFPRFIRENLPMLI